MSFFMMVLALHTVAANYSDYAKVLNELQGIWRIEYAEHRGGSLETISDNKFKLKGLQIKFEGQKVSFRFNNEWLPKEPMGTYKIDVSKSATKGIVDFTFSIPFICNVGIYRITNDGLTCCFAAYGLHADGDPPKQFSTSKEDHYYLLKLKRVR
jgi:hypothetical protein